MISAFYRGYMIIDDGLVTPQSVVAGLVQCFMFPVYILLGLNSCCLFTSTKAGGHVTASTGLFVRLEEVMELILLSRTPLECIFKIISLLFLLFLFSLI